MGSSPGGKHVVHLLSHLHAAYYRNIHLRGGGEVGKRVREEEGYEEKRKGGVGREGGRGVR